MAVAKGSMFANLGPALLRLRKLYGKSQAQVAQDALTGKSQLSKYETGKELPKLDSLERVLAALDVSSLEFFYTLHLMDGDADSPPERDRSGDVTAIFERLMSHLLDLHRQIVLETSRHGETPGEEG